MPTAIFSLRTEKEILTGIQIWSDVEITQPLTESRLSVVCAVNHQKIPVFLVSCGPFDVYTENHDSESYFYNHLVCENRGIGLLTKAGDENSEMYVVFYIDGLELPRVRCYYLDFSVVQQGDEFREVSGNEDVFFASRSRGNAWKSDTSVFDRVLELKTQRKTPNISTIPPILAVSLGLTTSHQISQAINRVVLSGLRLRGLSTNSAVSGNDKAAIREIYQMTKKAATFALRKYSYEFNGKSTEGRAKTDGRGVSLDEIQDIVESLLQTFVDVETTSFHKLGTGKTDEGKNE